jgi:hypothetical protein
VKIKVLSTRRKDELLRLLRRSRSSGAQKTQGKKFHLLIGVMGQHHGVDAAFPGSANKNSCRNLRVAISIDSFDFPANRFTSARPTTAGNPIVAVALRTSFLSASLLRPQNWWLKCATASFHRGRAASVCSKWSSTIESNPPEMAGKTPSLCSSSRRPWMDCSTCWSKPDTC